MRIASIKFQNLLSSKGFAATTSNLNIKQIIQSAHRHRHRHRCCSLIRIQLFIEPMQTAQSPELKPAVDVGLTDVCACCSHNR